tara:strand:+ start:700 stop:915 length:216 start_codon:yes stop_codon:yes gene_type:complete
MIDTDKYGMTNEELLERFSNFSVDDYKELLAEVKRLRNHIRRMRHWAEPKMHEVHHDAWRKLHDEIYEGDD